MMASAMPTVRGRMASGTNVPATAPANDMMAIDSNAPAAPELLPNQNLLMGCARGVRRHQMSRQGGDYRRDERHDQEGCRRHLAVAAQVDGRNHE